MVHLTTGGLLRLIIAGAVLLLGVVDTSHAQAGETLYFIASSGSNVSENYNWFSGNNWYTLDPMGVYVHAERLPTDQDTAVINTAVNVPGSVQLAQLIVTSTSTISHGDFNVGKVTLQGAVPAGATLKTLTLRVRNMMSIVGGGGAIDESTIIIEQGGIAQLFNDAGHSSSSLLLYGGTWIYDQGSLILSDGTGIGGEGGGTASSPSGFGNDLITVLPGADLRAYGTAAIHGVLGDHLTLDNRGTVREDAVGTFSVGGLESGVVWPAAQTTPISGAFKASVTGANLDFLNGITVNSGVTYTFKGPGLSHIEASPTVNGTVNVGEIDATTGLIDPGNVETDGGNFSSTDLDGTGTWHIVANSTASSTLTLKSTNLATTFTGALKVDPFARLNLAGFGHHFSNGTINNSGITTWTGSSIIMENAMVFNNLDGGLFDIQTDTLLTGSSARFNNAGAFRKSAGTGTTTVGVAFNNTGTVELKTGTTAFANYKQTAGELNLNGGNVAAPNNSLQINGGTLAGAGTITGDVTVSNGGILSPGHSPGTINVTGNYTQAATGLLNLELGGRTPGTQFDQLLISGAATLAGTLNVNLINGFNPTVTDRFPILRYASHTGAFTTLNGPFNATYNPTNVTLALNPNAPRIFSFTPGSGQVGANVVITGAKLGGGAVFFNGMRATVNTAQSSATRLVVTVPTGATTGPIRVTTSNGSASSTLNFTVVLTISGSITSGTAPIPGVSGPVPNVPVLLLERTNPAVLAAIVVNPTLLSGASNLLKRTNTNAQGQYSFVVQSGSYLVVAALPGVFFTPPFRQATITNAAGANQNFAGVSVDNTAPTVTVSSSSATSVSGNAGDSGSGVLTVVATLQNSAGQFLNWQAAGTTPQFTSAAVVGSFKLATVPSGTAPLLNLTKVSSQSWAVLLPAVLPAGSYRVTVRAIDRAFRVSLPVQRIVTKASATRDVRSAVVLSTATATATTDTVTLRFSGALDAGSAGDAAHYTAVVNGRSVRVESAAYNAGTATVSLTVSEGVLHTGDSVHIRCDGLVDMQGRPLDALASAFAVR